MKYEDRPTAQVEVVIGAPIEVVWELVIDIELPARFSSEFLGAEWMDDERGVGARFIGRSQHKAMGEWETVSYVSRYEPMRVFEWSVSDPDNPSSTWSFELESLEDSVLLRECARMGPAPSGLTIAITAMPDKEERIIARRLEEFEANMRATLEGIKQLAEQAR
jgi:hypothetical protein